jgi:hypothetical protein
MATFEQDKLVNSKISSFINWWMGAKKLNNQNNGAIYWSVNTKNSTISVN